MRWLKTAFLLLVTLNAYATGDWVLDEKQSSLHFLSTKEAPPPPGPVSSNNRAITETHQFHVLHGGVKSTGEAWLEVELTSVDTLIPIRDDRLRTIFFEAAKYPVARFITTIDLATYNTLPVNGEMIRHITGKLSLHGVEVPVSAVVDVRRPAKNRLVIVTRSPIVLKVSDFNLTEGLEQLRTLMQLQSISPDVPVTFELVFKEVEPATKATR